MPKIKNPKRVTGNEQPITRNEQLETRAPKLFLFIYTPKNKKYKPQFLPLAEFSEICGHFVNLCGLSGIVKRKGADLLTVMVSVTCMIYFGTEVLVVVRKLASEEVRRFFDILSASRFLLIFFRLLAQEESLKPGS